jgi:hypothetical protein
MKNKLVNKEDVKLVLYDVGDDEDFISLLITNKDQTSLRIIYPDNLSFSRELESLNIRFEEDGWTCYQEVDRNELKEKLERRNFTVIMGEDY